MCRWLTRVTGSLARCPIPRFAVRATSPPPAVLRNFRPGFALRHLRVLFGALAPAACPGLSTGAPSAGSLPSSRRQPTASTHARIPTRASVRPRRFSRPRRFTPRSAFESLFHLSAVSRVSLQGVVPPPEPHAVSRAVALVPFDASTCGCPRRPLRPRLQGLALRRSAVVLESLSAPANSAPLLGSSSSG
jgi:hypothetical protein